MAMRAFSQKTCQRFQRTPNLLSSYNATEIISRVHPITKFNQTCTTFSHHIPSRLFSNNNSPRKLNSKSLVRTDTTQESIARIAMLGLTASELSKPELYNMPLGVIEQRLQYCLEGGLKAGSACVVQFNQLIEQSISVLKSVGFMDQKVDVAQEIMSRMKFVGPYPSVHEDLSYRDFHFKVLNHCMEYQFDYTLTNWQRFQEAPAVYAHQNMVTIKQAGLNWSWVRNHPSLICYANPHNLFKIFELDRSYELPISIGNIMVKDADVAFIPYEDLKATFFILKKYKVCCHDLSKVIKMEHFLINPDYLHRLFQKIDTTPNPNKNNLLLIYKNWLKTSEKKRSISHLEKLISRQCNPQTMLSAAPEGSWQHEMKLWVESGDSCLEFKPCAHKPYLEFSDVYFEEHAGMSYTASEKTLNRRISKRTSKLPDMLAAELNLPVSKVKVELAHIPLALTVTTNDSYDTLTFLQERGFTTEQIAECLQLLLYNR
ncbi:Transcription elongation factor GreA [Frankliniella fusca]|uniref:Transcription elongation factor GreA n=1 Tax=Frankliniella fusca TaxID=407009 RepID=A0AAE1LQ43_9NEOP|nr:Transcription elongation factor GreA [Frankliniella fusca]